MTAGQARGARDRRTLRTLREIDDAVSAGLQVIVTGSGVHDLAVDSGGRALWLPDLFASYALERGRGLVHWRPGSDPVASATLAGGAAVPVRHRNGEAHPTESVRALVAEIHGAPQPATLVVDYMDLVLPRDFDTHDTPRCALLEDLQALASDRQWRSAGHQLVLIDRGGGITPRLVHQAGYRVVRFDAPDALEAEVFIQRKLKATATNRLHLAPELSVDHASRLTGGLLLRDVEAASALTSRELPMDAVSLSQLKGSAIVQQSAGTLELLVDAIDFATDVAGLPAVRLHLRDLQAIGRSTVRVLLAGPPGTGKTYSAQAIARLLGVPLVSFGRILGELLGQAEHNMDVALAVLESMAPVALFIDEADQGPLGTRRSAGASANEAYQALRAKLFGFLSDSGDDAGISVIATTNVPTARHLDSAALDRFQVIPVLCPTGPELVDVIRIQARRAGVLLGAGVEDAVRGYSGEGHVISARTATELITDARIVAAAHRREQVDGSDFATAFSQRFHDDWSRDVEYSTLVSIAAAKKEVSLPWVAAAALGEAYEPPAYLDAFLDPAGKLSVNRLLDRVAELEKMGAYRD